ncbi:MAG: ECF transporter S component [Clostridia bacterium]|nr:ECF transporter S component [Clostridia bacterium]
MNNLMKPVKTAAFAAIICVCTMLIAIPLPGNGYANLGDTMVIAAGFFLGPVYGFFAAAIGSAFADIFSSFALYAPATFVIKGLMALVVGVICKSINKHGFTARLIPASFLAELIMVMGYFIFELFIYDFGVAAVDVAGNAVQGVCGVAFSMLLVNVLNANKYVRKLIKI